MRFFSPSRRTRKPLPRPFAWPQPSSCLVGQLSSGAASQLAGVPKAYFLSHLADYGVDTFDLTEEETLHDFENA